MSLRTICALRGPSCCLGVGLDLFPGGRSATAAWTRSTDARRAWCPTEFIRTERLTSRLSPVDPNHRERSNFALPDMRPGSYSVSRESRASRKKPGDRTLIVQQRVRRDVQLQLGQRDETDRSPQRRAAAGNCSLADTGAKSAGDAPRRICCPLERIGITSCC